MVMNLDTSFTVTLLRTEIDGENELGNDVVQELHIPISVAGWSVPNSSEPKLAGHDRLEVDLELIAVSGHVKPLDRIMVPGFEKPFQVIGYAENYDSGPFGFVPGFEIVNLRSLE